MPPVPQGFCKPFTFKALDLWHDLSVEPICTCTCTCTCTRTCIRTCTCTCTCANTRYTTKSQNRDLAWWSPSTLAASQTGGSTTCQQWQDGWVIGLHPQLENVLDQTAQPDDNKTSPRSPPTPSTTSSLKWGWPRSPWPRRRRRHLQHEVTSAPEPRHPLSLWPKCPPSSSKLLEISHRAINRNGT